MDRRAVALPTAPAALATYGDVALADYWMQLAWADWRAGRLPLEEVFVWQAVHRTTLRGYLRLMTEGGTPDDDCGNRAVRPDDRGAGPGGVGGDSARGLTCPRCSRPLVGDFCGYCRSCIGYDAHSQSLPLKGGTVNASLFARLCFGLGT